MYQQNRMLRSSIRRNTCVVGERLEDRVHRMMFNNEPIGDGAPLIYTDRRRGVQAEHDIRTDKFDVAVKAMDKVHKDNLAKRIELYKPKEENMSAGTDRSTNATTN